MVKYQAQTSERIPVAAGDMILGTDNTLYYVAYDEHYSAFPVRIINMSTGTVKNGYRSFSSLNKEREISQGVEFAKIHKNEDITIIAD